MSSHNPMFMRVEEVPWIIQILVLSIFVLTYILALGRWIKLSIVSISAAVLIVLLGLIDIKTALFHALEWNVIGIYWGYLMVSHLFMESGMPKFLAGRILHSAANERGVLFMLACVTAALSSFMENVGVALMMAPIALEIAKKLNTSPFRAMVAVAISSNVVTTVTMIADPPPIILAMQTGMKFRDFYWFKGLPGLGTISIFAVAAALLTLLFQFRNLTRPIQVEIEEVTPTYGASALFVISVFILAVFSEMGFPPGIVGFAAGCAALFLSKQRKRMVTEFDWDSFGFILGIFVVVYSVRATGLLEKFSKILFAAGIQSPGEALASVTWVSVIFSSFMDNVPYTLLMIPVCISLAGLVGIEKWPLLFGMLVGTGVGGNITPVGAAANVFICGRLEKEGIPVRLKDYLKIGLPFSVMAVLTAHLLLYLIWI
jgi:Na+/H+ antiporter NhaD/arsenite permease-like protein